MKFEDTLLKGSLIKRYKRFFADVKVNNQIITSHCPNTGSMDGLLDEGNIVWVSKNNNPKRIQTNTKIIQTLFKTNTNIMQHEYKDDTK